MKTNITLGIFGFLMLLVGCTRLSRSRSYVSEQEFRRQIGGSIPVKDWGYNIELIRFSADHHKALVVFAVPGKTNLTEVILEDDGFRRYRGSVSDPERMERGLAAKPFNLAVAREFYQKPIIVTLPKSRGPAYRHEPEFRRQLTKSVPVRDWGYKLQDIRFSGDSHKALVICLEPSTGKFREFTLEDDGFSRFRCHLYDERHDFQSVGTLTITLPDK